MERQNITDHELIQLQAKQLELAFQEIEVLKERVAELENTHGGSKDEKKVYTNRELYVLKYEDSLSWSKLSQRTGIPVSTLQYRVRKYLEED